jgi:hypothetical protein
VTIGEARRNIERFAPDFVTAQPELPLSFAYDMRNIFVPWLLQSGPGRRLENH